MLYYIINIITPRLYFVIYTIFVGLIVLWDVGFYPAFPVTVCLHTLLLARSTFIINIAISHHIPRTVITEYFILEKL